MIVPIWGQGGVNCRGLVRELDWKSEVICVTMDEARVGRKQGMLFH